MKFPDFHRAQYTAAVMDHLMLTAFVDELNSISMFEKEAMKLSDIPRRGTEKFRHLSVKAYLASDRALSKLPVPKKLQGKVSTMTLMETLPKVLPVRVYPG